MAAPKVNQGFVPSIVKSNPNVASVMSKLTKDPIERPINPLNTNISQLALSTAEKITINDDIVDMFPDVELCIQILVSSIISPNDMTSTRLHYKAPDLKLPMELKQSIVKLIETHIEKNYNISSKLPTILREALFTKGAYIEAIIPEASLDDIISQYNYTNTLSIEDYTFRELNKEENFYLGKDNTNNIGISTESFIKDFNIPISKLNTIARQKQTFEINQEDLMLDITENHKVMLLSTGLIKHKEKLVHKRLYGNRLSTEDDEILDKFFREGSNYKPQDFIEVNLREDASRESIGRPFTLKLPVESVIPVHVVNDPTKHLGYFILLDNNGTPIADKDNSVLSNTESIVNTLTDNKDSGMGLIAKAAQALNGVAGEDVKLDMLEDIYSKLVAKLIKRKLATGMYGELVTIKDDADIYRVMFNRALKNQRTKILFLPSDLVAFYTFEYRENGTGKSLLEKASVLYSIRSMLLFSRIMGSIKNSTPVTEVSVTLDEADPDPNKTMEQVMSEVLNNRRNLLPLGIVRPDDLTEWVHRLGVSFKFQHPGINNLDISTSDVNVGRAMPDDDLENKIKEAIIMSYGLTPEIVESGYASDFATTVVAKNLLTAKRVTRTQELFNPLTTEHIRKIAKNDMELISSIKEIIRSNKAEVTKFINKLKNSKDTEYGSIFKGLKQSQYEDFITNVFISEIETYLPEPHPQDANNSKNAFEDYKSMLEDAMDLIFSTDAYPTDYVGSIGDKVDAIKGMFKSVLLRKWMVNNNYLPELGEFITKDDDGKPIFNALDEHSGFVDALVESYTPYIKTRLKAKYKADKKIEKIEQDAEEAAQDNDDDDSSTDDTVNSDSSTDTDMDTDTGDSSDSGTDTDSDSGDSDTGGDGDLGDMDLDMDMGDDDSTGDEVNSGGDEDKSGSGDDAAGGDDMGMDIGMDDFGDDMGGDSSDSDSSSGSKDSTPSPHEEELNKLEIKLKEAQLRKAEADADTAEAKAKEAKDSVGDPTTYDKQDNDNEDFTEDEDKSDSESDKEDEEPELEGEDNIGGADFDYGTIRIPNLNKKIII